MAVIETHIYSEILTLETEVLIIYPREHEKERQRKVLWLLHGGSGDSTSWLRNTSVERLANKYDITIIMPDAMNSCFTDMCYGGRFGSYITDELPNILKQLFPRLSLRREDNFISGFSNGGYGCLRLGLKNPIYSAIGAFSAGDKADVDFVNDGSDKARDRIEIFGDGVITGTDNDLKKLGREAYETGCPLPRVYHACGALDPWLGLNHKMRDFFMGFEGNPFDYVYHQSDGYGHEWPFWELELENFIKYLGLPERA